MSVRRLLVAAGACAVLLAGFHVWYTSGGGPLTEPEMAEFAARIEVAASEGRLGADERERMLALLSALALLIVPASPPRPTSPTRGPARS